FTRRPSSSARPSPLSPLTSKPCAPSKRQFTLESRELMSLLNFFLDLVRFFYKDRAEISGLTLEHLWLVATSKPLAAATGLPLVVADIVLPLCMLLTRWPRLRSPVLCGANVIQTIPSLALFGFLMPVPWLGERADRLAITALTAYALLPIIRNTYAGITGVDP